MLGHKPDANFLADSSFSKEKFFYIARQKGNTNILQEHRWSFVQLQKNSAKSISLHWLHQCNSLWEELFSATKSVHCTMCTFCTAQCANCALQRQLIFALWIVLYLHIFLGVDNIYEYICFLLTSLPAHLPMHIVHSRWALIFAPPAISRLKFVVAVFVNRRCVNVIGQTIYQVVFELFLLFLANSCLKCVVAIFFNGLSDCITF